LQVSAQHGTLTSVTVRNSNGRPVAGSYRAGSRSWHTGWALAPAQTYQVSATAVSTSHKRTVISGTFRTFRPAHSIAATTTITAQQSYGIGMPIMVSFSRPVTDKAAVERSLQITASKPVTGAWYWMNSKSVWFRPKHYWPAQHPGAVHRAPGRGAGRAGRVRPGQPEAALPDRRLAGRGGQHRDPPHEGVVERPADGQLADQHRAAGNGHRRWPLPVLAMASPVDMNSASIGIPPGSPGYYNELVYDAVQFTMSGTYIHSAPWSVGEQGIVNVSHGCVNVGPANAVWYYDHSMLGDPISVVGSPVRGTWNNGWTIYFLSWHKLLAGSATGDAVLASASGSQFVPASAVAPTAPAGPARPGAPAQVTRLGPA